MAAGAAFAVVPVRIHAQRGLLHVRLGRHVRFVQSDLEASMGHDHAGRPRRPRLARVAGNRRRPATSSRAVYRPKKSARLLLFAGDS
jgi:hypothetical protein